MYNIPNFKRILNYRTVDIMIRADYDKADIIKSLLTNLYKNR